MQLDFVPLLQVQRDLYRMPRGFERFREYLRTMTDRQTGDLELPLVAMNPMGKDHVPALLDTLIDLDAEAVGEAGVAAARQRVAADAGAFKVAIVVSDDAHGGWTNRYASEFSHRFDEVALYKRGWITAIVWTGDEPSREAVRAEVETAVYRAAHVQRNGPATTLREMLRQEGEAMALAGCTSPSLDDDDRSYTREVIAPLLDAGDRATVIACLFGDDAARMLGYEPRGLSHRAGLALALHDARHAAEDQS